MAFKSVEVELAAGHGIAKLNKGKWEKHKTKDIFYVKKGAMKEFAAEVKAKAGAGGNISITLNLTAQQILDSTINTDACFADALNGNVGLFVADHDKVLTDQAHILAAMNRLKANVRTQGAPAPTPSTITISEDDRKLLMNLGTAQPAATITAGGQAYVFNQPPVNVAHAHVSA